MGKLADPAGVAATAKIGGKESVNASLGHVAVGQPRAKRDHIRIVMFARKGGRKAVPRPAHNGRRGCG